MSVVSVAEVLCESHNHARRIVTALASRTRLVDVALDRREPTPDQSAVAHLSFRAVDEKAAVDAFVSVGAVDVVVEGGMVGCRMWLGAEVSGPPSQDFG